jgi:hypothetical protein
MLFAPTSATVHEAPGNKTWTFANLQRIDSSGGGKDNGLCDGGGTITIKNDGHNRKEIDRGKARRGTGQKKTEAFFAEWYIY